MAVSLKKLFRQKSGHFGHKGRPGRVGGSSPDGEGSESSTEKSATKGKRISVTTSQGKPLILEQDTSYSRSVPLPNGKSAKRYTILDTQGNSLGTITETRGYSDKKPTGQRYVTSRKEVVEYRAETFNQRVPTWERSYHVSDRQSAINWIASRS